jgi:hypothetical protein
MIVAALVSYFNDIDMLKVQFESGQFDKYDKVYIFDGPFDHSKHLNFLKDSKNEKLSETEFGLQLLRDPKFIYSWDLYQDEWHKRTSAYLKTDADLIFLHDSDEFYSIDSDELDRFIKSDCSVASFYCQNLFMNGVYASNDFYQTNEIKKLPHKNFIFKKNLVSPIEHLNYLWLVGVTQAPPDRSKNYAQPVASGYHFTAMRTDIGNIQKFIFYSSLFIHNNNENVPLNLQREPNNLSEISNLISCNEIDRASALKLYLRSISGFARVPDPSKEMIFQRRILINELEPILFKILHQINFYLDKELILINNLNCYVFIPAELFRLDYNLSSDFNFNVEIYNIKYNEKYEIFKYSSIRNFRLLEQVPQHSSQIGALLKLSTSHFGITKLTVNCQAAI